MTRNAICKKCGYTRRESDTAPSYECPQCGVIYSKIRTADSPPPQPRRSTTRKKSPGHKRAKMVLAAGAPIALLLFFGQFHLVRGADYSGPLLIKKRTFGFDETFVNTDKFINLPWIAAKTNNPLAVEALQRAGVLESDAARERRIRSEVDAEMRAAQKEISRDVKALQRQLKAEADDAEIEYLRALAD